VRLCVGFKRAAKTRLIRTRRPDSATATTGDASIADQTVTVTPYRDQTVTTALPGHEEWNQPMDWRHTAACLDEDPELFFPIGNTGPAILQIEEAKAVCRRCDVVETCLRWALDTGQDAGVWGGLSEDERRALKRRNARARRAG
jgi:WhiB family redox-sensing transcriptional regulator